MVETYLSFLDLGYHEMKDAFKGLADENVWKRPAGGLLSIGELAGHIAYWQAVRLTGEASDQPLPDLTKCKVHSPLIDQRFAYYPKTILTSPSEEHRAMGAEQVCKELLRVHAESIAYLKELDPDLNSTPPWWWAGSSYFDYLKYATFHIAYHTGQMYSVRHLLGDEPPNN